MPIRRCSASRTGRPRRKPDRIEQASEPVKIEHAVDPATGRFLPARLRIKLVAPDFEIRGASEQLVDVAPDEYSQRVAFLMTPRRTGFSRVNVEVYAADTVYLGAIAIESEVVAEGVRQAPLCTADLVLNVAETEAPLVDSTVIVREPADPPTAMVAPSPAPPRSSSRVRTLALALSAAAVLMVAIQVQQSLNISTATASAFDADSNRPPDATAAPRSSAGGGPPPLRRSSHHDRSRLRLRLRPRLPRRHRRRKHCGHRDRQRRTRPPP